MWRAQMPTGVSQLASSAATAARSAVSSTRAARSVIAPAARAASSSSARAWTARDPWPGAGTISSAPKRNAIASARPSRCRPAAARTMPYTSPASSFPSRVSTFPRRAATSRSGRSASSCERRRRLEVPTRVPSARSPRDSASPTNASAGSSRAGTATSASPSVPSPGRSFAECTARSTSPSRSRRSTPRTKRDLSPGSPSDALVGTTSAPPSDAATRSAWARASALPRVPRRSGGLMNPSRPPSAALHAAFGGLRPLTRMPASPPQLPHVALALERLALGVEAEQVAQRGDLGIRVILVRGATHPQRRLVKDAACDRLRHRLHPLAVALREALPARLVLRQDPLDDLIAPRAQGGDGRRDVLGREPALEARELRAKHAVGAARLGLAPRRVSLHERLEVVHVVERHPGELATRGVDITRHCQVDQQQRPVGALAHHLGQGLALDDAVGRARGRGHDVGLRHLLR